MTKKEDKEFEKYLKKPKPMTKEEISEYLKEYSKYRCD